MYRGVTRLVPLCSNDLPIIRFQDCAWCFSLQLLKQAVLICYVICSCRHHQQGRWQARIGRVAGNKDLYLGTFGKDSDFR